MKVEVVRESKDGLSRTRWTFDFYVESYCGGPRMRLDEYVEETRESKRKRSWSVAKLYYRIGDTRCYRQEQMVQAKDVPIWSDVEQEAKRKIEKLVWAMEVEVHGR